MLKFDATTARLVEDAYLGSDFVRRRLANFEALDPRPGERLVDIGCGPGLLTSELARAVGDAGEVIAVDPSADMREAAIRRCGERPNTRVLEGSAARLPIGDASADKAVAVQVFEYLDDIPGALAEAWRVLRPQGRLVIGDMHWDTLAWFSEDGQRMTRMVSAWDRHLVEPRVPALLTPMLRRAGFTVEGTRPLTCCDTTCRPDGLANMLLRLMQSYARDDALLDPDEVADWAAEQRRLAEEGRFFFSLTHYVVSARKG